MGRPLTLDQLRQDVGLMVERITHVTMMLQRCQLRMEEYVCLKVIAMLSQRKYQFLPKFNRLNDLIRLNQLKSHFCQLTWTSARLFSQWKQQCGIGNDSRAVHAMSAEFCRTKLPPVTWSFFWSPHSTTRGKQCRHDTSPAVTFNAILLFTPQVQSAATLLLESKMFYVPFLLNSAIQR